MSVVTPILKSMDPTSPSNYRPISLLAILSKVLERHVSSLILEELHLSDHPSFHQWGFRAGHSTGSALTTIIDDWLRSMDAGKPVCSVFFDVRKAFDSVPHATLVSKLQSRGLNDFLLRWICDYLKGMRTTGCPKWCLFQTSTCSLWSSSGVGPRASFVHPLHQ